MQSQGQEPLDEELLDGCRDLERPATTVLVLVWPTAAALLEAFVDPLQKRQARLLTAQVADLVADALPGAAMHVPKQHSLALIGEVEGLGVSDLLNQGHCACVATDMHTGLASPKRTETCHSGTSHSMTQMLQGRGFSGVAFQATVTFGRCSLAV